MVEQTKSAMAAIPDVLRPSQAHLGYGHLTAPSRHVFCRVNEARQWHADAETS